MSVYLHVTLEIHAASLPRFLDAMEKTAVPILEGEGWRLAGAFVQRSGRLGNVIDLWELDDFQHYDRALKVLGADAAFPAFKQMLDEAVISETVVFADALPYMRRDGPRDASVKPKRRK
jgi:hypothetical protein